MAKGLITSAGNKVKLVQEFQKWGAAVVAEDSNPQAKACLVADEFYQGQKVDFIIPTRDFELKQYCGVPEAVVSDEFTLYETLDKAEFSRFCRRHGFSIPETMQFNGIAKLRNGSGSREQFRITRAHIVQEFIDWPEYSIDYFADQNENVVSVIPRKRLKIINGESTDAEIDFNTILVEQAKKMGQELHIKGPATMQLFFNGKDIKWIEVNPRFGGGSHLTWHIFSGPRYILENFKMRESNVSKTPKGSSM